MKIKKWTPVIVHWGDAHGAPDGNWQSADTLLHKPTPVVTVGLLWQYDSAGVTVVHCKAGDDVGGYTFVPKANIRSIKPLK